MGDDVLSKYLPSKRQLSNKLPERHFFFGLLATLRKQYLTDVVRSAQDKRYSVQENDPKRQAILVTDKWQEELMRHPYQSRKPSPSYSSRESRHRRVPPERASQAAEGKEEHRQARDQQAALQGGLSSRSGSPAAAQRRQETQRGQRTVQRGRALGNPRETTPREAEVIYSLS